MSSQTGSSSVMRIFKGVKIMTMTRYTNKTQKFYRIKAVVFLSGILLITPITAAYAVSYASPAAPQSISWGGTSGGTYGDWTANRVDSSKVRSKINSAHYRYVDSARDTIYIELRSGAPGHATKGQSSHDNNVVPVWSKFRSVPNLMLFPTSKGKISIKAAIVTCIDRPLAIDKCSASKSLSTSLTL